MGRSAAVSAPNITIQFITYISIMRIFNGILTHLYYQCNGLSTLLVDCQLGLSSDDCVKRIQVSALGDRTAVGTCQRVISVSKLAQEHTRVGQGGHEAPTGGGYSVYSTYYGIHTHTHKHTLLWLLCCRAAVAAVAAVLLCCCLTSKQQASIASR